ncbi:hypothetical protein SAMN05446935_7227 [Burkholderia sp. YR290]|nr:hypothetical protein SAMN05192544_101279 [Paraburkholderia hospita]SKC91668.1 hypothetical protein SAMN05446934_5888 [Paraburkholderia hospita]SKC91755.1 hypothetical protein SAMN05445504_6334 [Burkholderia sp. CF099]SOE86712.1 hypothetical protein SAMN05446935_7227 [Burkholderia sp. YR290]
MPSFIAWGSLKGKSTGCRPATAVDMRNSVHSVSAQRLAA